LNIYVYSKRILKRFGCTRIYMHVVVVVTRKIDVILIDVQTINVHLRSI